MFIITTFANCIKLNHQQKNWKMFNGKFILKTYDKKATKAFLYRCFEKMENGGENNLYVSHPFKY